MVASPHPDPLPEGWSLPTSRTPGHRGRFVRMGSPLLGCPEGTSENSPAFQRWVGRPKVASPEGTVEFQFHTQSFSRPFGTCVPCGIIPGVKTPGYSQDVHPGQRNVATAFSADQATLFMSDAFKGISRLRCPARRTCDTIISEVERDGVRVPLAVATASRAYEVRGILSPRVRARGKEAPISRTFVSWAAIFSFTALLMLLGTPARAGLAKADVFSGVRPSSAAATSARSSGSDCPNATGSFSAPEDGRTPLNSYVLSSTVFLDRPGDWKVPKPADKNVCATLKTNGRRQA